MLGLVFFPNGQPRKRIECVGFTSRVCGCVLSVLVTWSLSAGSLPGLADVGDTLYVFALRGRVKLLFLFFLKRTNKEEYRVCCLGFPRGMRFGFGHLAPQVAEIGLFVSIGYILTFGRHRMRLTLSVRVVR